MKKYCYKYSCHVFNEKGTYLGFQEEGKDVNPEYSSMVKEWVNKDKKLTDLLVLLTEAGFTI